MTEELPPPTGRMLPRLGVMIALISAITLLCYPVGLNPHQVLSVGIFLSVIFGTLFFWSFRLAVILFLVGMMVLVGP